ncbi:murein transglycosylase [Algimonas arctica]|uniref:Murein transglycosylase n=2 Tax=Algimonas arctica TaxID=1479486 RepID=A0A8J3CPK7_9PROT|nr:murein transglycosylase [Algimonas arctica]
MMDPFTIFAFPVAELNAGYLPRFGRLSSLLQAWQLLGKHGESWVVMVQFQGAVWVKTLFLCLVLGLAPLIATPAVAQNSAQNNFQTRVVPLPRLKPAPPALSEYLSPLDAIYLRRGLSAAGDGDWRELKKAKDSIQDPTAKDLLRWVRSERDPNVPTDWLTYVVHDLSDWPRMVSIQAKAEARLFDDPLSSRRTLEWFNGKEPVSGEGRAALARALYQAGDRDQADRWLKSAWRDARLSRDVQRDLFQEYRSRLSEQDHVARADHLIWLGSRHFSNAKALLPHMNREERAVMEARMELASNGRNINAAVDAIPANRVNDAGFLFERARWRRKRKSNDYALPVYLQIGSPPTTENGQERMWAEKKLMAYWLMGDQRWAEAYRMTEFSGATSGAPFFESEFLGGWLALTKLGQPGVALERFQRLESGVTTPISLSRAHYWQGRAMEPLNDPRRDQAYAAAAKYPNTYYGQLATKRLQGQTARLTLPPQMISPQARQRFEADPRVKALRLLGEAGEERYFSTFAYALDDDLESLDELALLSQVSADYSFMRPSIRAAKQAGRFQSMLTENGYPIVAPIEALGAEFDIPFVYAIARQESEFAANAVSSASAFGMMQMINATASATARRHRIPYDRDRLITDRDYAARMGALHLHDLLEDFDGSYIMAAVAYNAGPRRVRQWIERNGDPRTGQIDPIDWVEQIPFSETRNYVQRVMENMQVYEARRNGNVAPVTIDQDLRFGSQHPSVR